MSRAKPSSDPKNDRPRLRDYIDLRRIAVLTALIAGLVLLLSLLTDINFAHVWKLDLILLAGLIGAFFVFAWAEYFADTQVHGLIPRGVVVLAVRLAYAFSVFLLAKALLGI